MAISTINAPAAGTPLPFDSVGSAQYPLSKIAFGADGAATPVADANGARLPVLIYVPAGQQIGLDAATLAALENIGVTITGPLPAGTNNIGIVDLSAAALAALEAIQAAVTGTVALDAPTLAALEAIQAAVTGTVELGATSLAALETIGIGQPLPAGNNNIGDVDVASVPTLATTTREYGAGYRAAVGASPNTFAIAGNLTLGATREVRIRASSACWVRFGTAGQDASVPAANSAALSFPVDPNDREVLRIPAGATHISVIRDSADGAVTFTPVA